MATQEQVLEALSHVQDPELHRSLTELNMVREVQVRGGEVDITIVLTVPTCPLKAQIEKDVRAAVSALPGVKTVNVKMGAMTDAERQAVFGKAQEGSAASVNQVDRVVAVMSGKGGVGKSLVTALLATALTRAGYRTGILDADITGPSMPKLFGLQGPVLADPLGMRPAESAAGIKIISANLLLQDPDQPIVWRGPMIGRAITQLWGDVVWEELDYLLVDLPPGTSDASLTVMQSLPLSGIVMVTTPQSLAAMIVRKAVHMARLVGVPISGVVENMAYYLCPQTGQRHEIFGPSHITEVTDTACAPRLAQLPIDPQITALCDEGEVEAVNLPEADMLLQAFLKAIPPAGNGR